MSVADVLTVADAIKTRASNDCFGAALAAIRSVTGASSVPSDELAPAVHDRRGGLTNFRSGTRSLFAKCCRGLLTLFQTVAMLLVAFHPVEGSATTFASIPVLRIADAQSGSVDSLKLFPSDEADAPTHLLVVSDDGRTTRQAVDDFPLLWVRDGVLQWNGQIVRSITAARCLQTIDDGASAAPGAITCTPVEATLMLVVDTPRTDGDDQERIPRMRLVAKISDVSGAIWRLRAAHSARASAKSDDRIPWGCRPEKSLDC